MSVPPALSRLAGWVISASVPAAERDAILGDLYERTARETGASSTTIAGARQLGRALSIGLHFTGTRSARWLRDVITGRTGSRAPTPSPRGDWNMLTDLRLAVRTLLRRPVFSMVVVLTLMLGVGVNTAIFTVVRNVVLRPVPYPEPDRLASLWMEFRRDASVTGFEIVASEPEYLEFVEQARSFEDIAGYWLSGINLAGSEQPVRVRVGSVTANFFDVIGIPPGLGRPFVAGEDLPGAPKVAVISDGLWARAYGRDPNLLGRTISADGATYEIVGIMPEGFQFPGADVDLLRTVSLDPQNPGRRSSHYLQLLGRLRSGVTIEAAMAETDLVNQRLEAAQPGLHGPSGTHPMVMASYQQKLTRGVRPALWILTGAALLVLLIACANVANLMFARSEAREHELAVRQALGAGRGRLVAHLMMESLVLSVVGAGLGLAISAWVVPILATMGADHIPRSGPWQVDGMVIGFAGGLAALTCLAFGLAPAMSSSRMQRHGLRERTAGGVRHRVRTGLLVSQLALAVVLLISAGVLGRNLLSLLRVDPGFDPDGVVAMTFELDATRYPTPELVAGFHQRLDERLAALPSVAASGAIRSLPLAVDGGLETVSASGARVADDEHVNVTYQVASPGYFAALSIPLLDGRRLDESDRAGAEPVVVINEAMARRYWPDGSAIGNTIQLGLMPDNPNPVMRIVGIVGNVIQSGLGGAVAPQVFAPRAQAAANYNGMGTRGATLVVKGSVAPPVLMEQARAAFRDLDATIPLTNLRTMRSVVTGSVSDERFMSLLLGTFSVVALTLAAIGVYGLMSYLVVQRTREIGVRMALGASAGRVIGDVVGRSVAATTVGIVIGLAAALAATRLLGAFVTLGSVRDPLVFLLGPLVLLAAAVAAAWGPARRAAAVDPMVAVRAD